VVQRKIGEQARIGNAKEEHYLFQGEACHFHIHSVARVKAPNPEIRENHIPDNEYYGRDRDRRKSVSPFSREPGFRVETEKKRDNEGKDIDPQVKVF